MSGETDPARGPRSARVGKRLALALLVVLVVGGPFIYWRTYRALEWYCWLDRRPFAGVEECGWTVEIWAHRFRTEKRIAFLFDPAGELALSGVESWKWLEDGRVEVHGGRGRRVWIEDPILATRNPDPRASLYTHGWPIPDPFYSRWPKLPMRTDTLPYPLEPPPPR